MGLCAIDLNTFLSDLKLVLALCSLDRPVVVIEGEGRGRSRLLVSIHAATIRDRDRWYFSGSICDACYAGLIVRLIASGVYI